MELHHLFVRPESARRSQSCRRGWTPWSPGRRATGSIADCERICALAEQLLDLQRLEANAKPRERGAGLGLNLVLQIARRHGAQMTVLPSPSGGACIRMAFGKEAVAQARLPALPPT
jgi:signal transduction histidine kinase